MKKKISKLQKKKNNPGSKYWKNKADKEWSRVIRLIYSVCAVCGKSPIDPHHLIGRANTATRHSVENGIGLCSLHHVFCNKLSAHGAPLAFSEWLQQNKPHTWDWCSKNKNLVQKPDYEAAYYKLKELT